MLIFPAKLHPDGFIAFHSRLTSHMNRKDIESECFLSVMGGWKVVGRHQLYTKS